MREYPLPGGSRPVTYRLNSRLDRSDPEACWPYQGGHSQRSGHKQIWCEGGMRHVHRVAWEMAHGPIPEGLCVLHRCDNPPCCNPAHLWLGTIADNNADRDRKGRGVMPTPDQIRRRPAGPIKHGTIYAYVKRRCTCDDCRSAMRSYRANRKRGAAVDA